MNRSLRYWTLVKGLSPYSTLPSALVQALTPQEVCAALDFDIEHPHRNRARVLRRVASDMAESFQPFHREAVEMLLTRMKAAPNRKLPTYGFFLRELFAHCPQDVRRKIIGALLSCKNRKPRQSGFRCLSEHWSDQWRNAVQSSWLTFGDSEAVALILEHFPTEFIEAHFEKLFSEVPYLGAISKLFLRAPSFARIRLPDLERLDRITYVYVCSKLKVEVDDVRAEEIYCESLASERLGLLLWSFGRLGKWELLERLAEEEQRKWANQSVEKTAPAAPSP